MTWVLLTGTGLVAETVVIVVLGRQATARSDAGVPLLGPSPSASFIRSVAHPPEAGEPAPQAVARSPAV